MVKGVNADAVDIVEPAKVGYQLTLRLNFDKIPRGKGFTLLHIPSTIEKTPTFIMIRNMFHLQSLSIFGMEGTLNSILQGLLQNLLLCFFYIVFHL